MHKVGNYQFDGPLGLSTPNPFSTTTEYVTVVALDLEWTKDYSRPDSNDPFCFSCVTVRFPAEYDVRTNDELLADIGYVSYYVDDPAEQAELSDLFLSHISDAFCSSTVVVGHQLFSDIGVASKRSSNPSVADEVRSTWHTRVENPVPARCLDTRYDLTSDRLRKSRRLVDVCLDLHIDVQQPETRRESMTKIQNTFAQSGNQELRDRLTVLNMRHSLSTAIVGMKQSGYLNDTAPINTNALIRRDLWDVVAYVDSVDFEELL